MNAIFDTVNGWGMMAALAAGLLLGLVYFGGLWWTVRRLASWRRPALVFLVSFVLRMGISLVGLLLMVRAGWPYLVAGLLAMLAVRLVLTRRLGPVHTGLPGG